MQHSLQRRRTGFCKAVATNLMIDKTRAILVYGQDRASVMTAIACRVLLPLFSWLLRRRAAPSGTRVNESPGVGMSAERQVLASARVPTRHARVRAPPVTTRNAGPAEGSSGCLPDN